VEGPSPEEEEEEDAIAGEVEHAGSGRFERLGLGRAVWFEARRRAGEGSKGRGAGGE